jgi:hypothetical protein
MNMMKKFLLITVLSMLPFSGAMAMEPEADDPVPPERKVQFKVVNPEMLKNPENSGELAESAEDIWAISIHAMTIPIRTLDLFHDLSKAEMIIPYPYQVGAYCTTGYGKTSRGTRDFKSQHPLVHTVDPDKINVLEIITFRPEYPKKGDCELKWLEPQQIERQ